MNAIVRLDDDSKFTKMIDGETTPVPVVQPAEPEPGIYEGISNEDYHSGPGVSKSGLWTIYKKTPAHFKFPPEKKESAQSKATKDLGTGTHMAILEPNEFEKRAFRGPEDRKGNKWKDAEEHCKIEGKFLLVESAYDTCLRIRDGVHRDAWINAILTQGDGINEATAYSRDPETGVLRRARPDRWRRDLGVIVDIKTCESVERAAFAKAVKNYGYHCQDPHYSDVLQDLGETVNAFIFIGLEKESPWAADVFELPASFIAEGREIMRQSLNRYAECLRNNVWPAYRTSNEVKELRFKKWDYEVTPAPLDEQEAA